MSVLIVGSTALDSIKTPRAENPRLLGGSASHAAVAASFFGPVRLVGIVGADFPARYLNLYRKHKIDLEGLQIAPGKTFHWSGEYEVNMNNRRTLATELGVFETFLPRLPESYRDSPFVLLANIAPSLQSHVLDQMRRPKFVVADTMDLWLNIALADLLKLLKRVDGFVLNESEARQLAQEDNLVLAAKKIHRLGPRHVIVKKGEHGAILSSGGQTVPVARLSAPPRGGPDGRGRLLRRGHDGLAGRRARPGGGQPAPGHGLWQRGGVVLLRGLRPDGHDARQPGRHRRAGRGVAIVDAVLKACQ